MDLVDGCRDGVEGVREVSFGRQGYVDGGVSLRTDWKGVPLDSPHLLEGKDDFTFRDSDSLLSNLFTSDETACV